MGTTCSCTCATRMPSTPTARSSSPRPASCSATSTASRCRATDACRWRLRWPRGSRCARRPIACGAASGRHGPKARLVFSRGASGHASMVTETDVVMAYRLLLGREPESADVVCGKVGHFLGLEELRHAFLTCEEFATNFGSRHDGPV